MISILCYSLLTLWLSDVDLAFFTSWIWPAWSLSLNLCFTKTKGRENSCVCCAYPFSHLPSFGAVFLHDTHFSSLFCDFICTCCTFLNPSAASFYLWLSLRLSLCHLLAYYIKPGVTSLNTALLRLWKTWPPFPSFFAPRKRCQQSN